MRSTACSGSWANAFSQQPAEKARGAAAIRRLPGQSISGRWFGVYCAGITAINALSQCSAILSPSMRNISNHVVVYF